MSLCFYKSYCYIGLLVLDLGNFLVMDVYRENAPKRIHSTGMGLWMIYFVKRVEQFQCKGFDDYGN